MATTPNPQIKRTFAFGRSTVTILEGDILDPQDENGRVTVDAVASSDDNYLTMAGGVSALLRLAAGDYDYICEAQQNSPVAAGAVVVTRAFGLKDKVDAETGRAPLGVDHVLHVAVVDYDQDLDDAGISALVERATWNCLVTAEQQRLKRILLPAFATGAAGLKMQLSAEHMAKAIKAYLAQPRPLEALYIVLYRDPNAKKKAQAIQRDQNDAYLRAANQVFGVPYDPSDKTPQVRDFYGRHNELARLQDVLAGKVPGKKHVVILGGRAVGKETLLDQLYAVAHERDDQQDLAHRPVARLTFGAVHKDTPLSFVYRKFLHALAEEEQGSRREAIRAFLYQITDDRPEAAADCAAKDTLCDRFLCFLAEMNYREVIFLINRLPNLLEIEKQGSSGKTPGVREFWQDLDKLQERVRFAYTARQDEYRELYSERLLRDTDSFHQQIDELTVACVSGQERESWTDEVFQRYLACDAPGFARTLIEEEAGYHPFLISLVSSALVAKLKSELLAEPDLDLNALNQLRITQLTKEIQPAIQPARDELFRKLLDDLNHSMFALEYDWNTKRLAKAIAAKAAIASLTESEYDLRMGLDSGILRKLQLHGLIIYPGGSGGDEPEDEGLYRLTVDFMAPSFARYVQATLVQSLADQEPPDDVVISVLARSEDAIRTLFRDRRAKVIAADKWVTKSNRDEFFDNYRGYLEKQYPERGQAAGPAAQMTAFSSPEQIGNFLLTQFATVDIKRYLSQKSTRSTVLFMVEDAYQEIPWELMLEAAYEGEPPFQVGRVIVSKQQAQSVRAAVDTGGALLIGNPSGDLPTAVEEVTNLADSLRRTMAFNRVDVWTGQDICSRIRILNALSSGEYSLVHYSGHSVFAGSESAWRVADGAITTSQLTSAVENAPPVFVFSSSCESAEASRAVAIQFEGQTFDLPGAFLQAGVQAYVGTLWPIDGTAARRFSEDFYSAFLWNNQPLGECLRTAKWQLKQEEQDSNKINWLAYILYGDPHLRPDDLLPALAKPSITRA